MNVPDAWDALRRLRSGPTRRPGPGSGAHRRPAGPTPEAVEHGGHAGGTGTHRAVSPAVPAVADARRAAIAALGVLLGEGLAAAAEVTTPGGRLLLPGLRPTRVAAETRALDAPGLTRLRAVLEGAPPVFAAYLFGTLATGRGIELVESLARAVAGHQRDANWLHRHLGVLDGLPGPATFADDDGSKLRLRQFSPVMSGPTALILLRVFADPAYALWLTSGAHVDNDRPPDGLPFEHRFRTQQARVHEAISKRALGPASWPRFLGTPPWALARFVNRFTVLAGARFGWQDAGDGERVPDLVAAVLDALEAGVPVPLYLGRPGERHVVLAFGRVPDSSGERLRLYDPARGEVLDTDVAGILAGRGVVGWERLEGVLVPLPLTP